MLKKPLHHLLLSVSVCVCLWPNSPALAQGGIANLKVVTDANPDYSDMESMVHSITANHNSDADKMWVLFYWDHIARRYSWQPMVVHGTEVVDPIRVFNDYGYTNFATIAGIKCSEWNYMGYPCRYFSGVSDVWYDHAFHAYDNNYSCLFALPDSQTIASVPDIGKTQPGPDGKKIPGYLALYHALNGTSPNGYLEGADTDRPLSQIAENYAGYHNSYCTTSYNQDRGHRYILNLRPGETFTRYYHRLDTQTPHAVVWDQNNFAFYKSDTAYFVPNGQDSLGNPLDPEMLVHDDHIRANGERTFTPSLDEAHLAQGLYDSSNLKAVEQGIAPASADRPAVAIYKIEGANVITSAKVRALFSLATKDDSALLAYSTNNGVSWTEFWKSETAGNNIADLRLLEPINGCYDFLVKVTLKNGGGVATNATLKSISFDTITQLNSKTQPQLRIGKNTIYVGAGEQTDSIVLWPDLRDKKYAPYQEENIAPTGGDLSYQGIGILRPDKREPAYVVFKVDAPTDITGFTYGGRLSNRSAKSHIDFLHSFDNGKTWQKDYTLADASLPSDTIHYESVREVPANTRSVLFKYLLTPDQGREDCSLYSVHMEVNHKLSAPGSAGGSLSVPLEVTFKWRERQEDYTTAPHSHTQFVDHLPFTYEIDVNGADHPIIDALTIRNAGVPPTSDVKPGYSTTAPATQPAKKWIPNWVTYGNNLALHKTYTVSRPSGDFWGSGDPHLKKLTDGVVGSNFSMGPRFPPAAAWAPNTNPEITVDLGDLQKCAAFRIHTLGWEPWDAIKGQDKDKIEVLTSTDGTTYTSQGFFNCNLRWKDLPVNFMFPDDETLGGYNFTLPLQTPVEARYVKYKITTPRIFATTEVQVLDSYKSEPYDLNIALPNPADNGKPSPKPDLSPNAITIPSSDHPQIGQPLK